MRGGVGLVGLGFVLGACSFDTSGLQPRGGELGADRGPSLEAGADRDGPFIRRDGVPDREHPSEASRDHLAPDLALPCAGIPGACSGQKPICEGTCRACADHSECPAGLCRADGSCPAAGSISFVDDGCGGTQDGSAANPYCKVNDAVGKPPPYILVRPGSYTGDTIINTSKEVYGEPGAILKPAACDKVALDGKIDVLLAGFEIQGNVVLKGGARGTLLRNQIGPSACTGVNATGSELVLERNLLFGHTGGGLLLDGKYRVRNNIIVRNGKVELTWGAVKVAATDPTSLFINNTVANNTSKGSNDKEAGGIRCEGPAATATFVNTIVWGNTFNKTTDDAKDRQVGPGCQALFSLEELKAGATPASSNLSLPPQFGETGADTGAPYYRLKTTSPAKNKGTAKDAPAIDYDGEPRDALPDLGADEIFP